MAGPPLRRLSRPASGPLHVNEQRRSPRSSAPAEATQPGSPLATARRIEQKQHEDALLLAKQEAAAAAAAAEEEEEPQCTYNAERVIGNGTFGIVYSARIVETDETVAIKKVFVDRRYRNRELQVWRELRHPNIVALKHAFYTSGDSADELYLNMVMEFVPETVYCVMRRFTRQGQHVPQVLVRLYVYQACRALAHLHGGGVVHRDIKPQNLLVDAERGHLLKLCDFGSAAYAGQGRPPLVAYICSRYYRAPELIFGSTNYGSAVDLWSIGCVLAEMLRGRPLFPGENGVDQLVEIVKVLGTPSRRQIMAMNPQYQSFAFPSMKARGWGTVLRKSVGPESRDLLGKLLDYDPEARVRPLEACAHACFDGLREEQATCPDGQPLPKDLFNFTQREQRCCPADLRERLVPPWHNTQNPGSLSPVPVPTRG